MPNNEISIEKLVLGFESGFSVILYFICTFLAIFATAHLVPRMQEKGTIDLYLSRPVSRVKLLMSTSWPNSFAPARAPSTMSRLIAEAKMMMKSVERKK